MQQRLFRAPADAEDGDERRRRDEPRGPVGDSSRVPAITGRRPAQQLVAANDPRLALPEDERAVGQLGELGIVEAMRA